MGQIYSEKIQVGDLRYNSDLGIFEGYSGGNVSFDGLYDNHRDTFMDPSNNRFRFVTGNAYNTLLNGDILETTRLDPKTVYLIDSNIVTSATSNADIPIPSKRFRTHWSKKILVFKNSTITNTPDTFTSRLADVFSYLKFDLNYGTCCLHGDDTTDPELPEQGQTRSNTQRGYS